MNFVAVDVETANADLSSICQVGLVVFEEGIEVANWTSLVNPEDYFDPYNVYIHGISEDDVAGAPTWTQVYDQVSLLLSDRVSVCHMSFDRVAISRVCERYSLAEIPCIWLDTAKVVRRTWSEFSYRGYGLASIAKHLGIEFVHHDALEDARASGQVLIQAIQTSGLDLVELISRTKRPIDGSASSSYRFAQDGNPDGHLFGQTIVFTGSLMMSRREAARLAADAGCEVADSVTKSTTLLVVGDQDVRRLSGHDKSSKHRKAEQLQSQGVPLRILTEKDFLQLLAVEAS